MYYWVAAKYHEGHIARLLVTTNPIELMEFQKDADFHERDSYGFAETALPALKVLLQELTADGAVLEGNAAHLA